MRHAQTAVIYLLSKFGNAIIGFLATIYFTRVLGAEIYGYYAIALALVSWFGLIKSVGVSKAIIKRMSEDEEQADAYLVAGMSIKIVLTVIVVLIILFFRDGINSYVGQSVSGLIILVLLASVLGTIVNASLQGTYRVHIYAMLSTAKEFARVVAMVLLVFIGWELTGMLFGYAVGTAIISLVGLAIVKPALVLPRTEHFTNLFDFAKYSWLGDIQTKTVKNADIVILGLFVPASLTGVYAVAYSLSKFLDSFARGISTTLFPEMSNLSAEEDYDNISKLTESALTYAGLFLIPGIVGAAILGDRLMLIFGSEFERGGFIVAILIVGILIFTYAKQLISVLNAVDRPDLSFYSNGVFIISNISLNLILVWKIGWVGAALATVLSSSILFLITYHLTQKVIGFDISYRNIGYSWFAAIVMGIFVYLARRLGEKHWIALYNEVFVISLVCLGAIIYFLILYIISKQFRKIVNENIPLNIRNYV